MGSTLANGVILHDALNNLGVANDKVFYTIEQYGNTAAASVPITLHSAFEAGKVHEDQYILLFSFGGGMTWGSCLLHWQPVPARLPVLHLPAVVKPAEVLAVHPYAAANRPKRTSHARESSSRSRSRNPTSSSTSRERARCGGRIIRERNAIGGSNGLATKPSGSNRSDT